MPKLTPPDLEQCQAQQIVSIPLGVGVPPRRYVRCGNRAAYVIRETKPGPDGRLGAMSVCKCCLVRAKKILSNLKIEPIRRSKCVKSSKARK